MVCAKRSLDLIAFLDSDIVVAPSNIELSKVLGILEGVNEF
jgi:hypothetical protein